MGCTSCPGHRTTFEGVVTEPLGLRVHSNGSLGEVVVSTSFDDQRNGAESWRHQLPVGPVTVKLILSDVSTEGGEHKQAWFVPGAVLRVNGRFLAPSLKEGEPEGELTVAAAHVTLVGRELVPLGQALGWSK